MDISRVYGFLNKIHVVRSLTLLFTQGIEILIIFPF